MPEHDPALDVPPVDIDDPYSSAIASALMAIRIGITLQGSMNETEHANLLAIEEYITFTKDVITNTSMEDT